MDGIGKWRKPPRFRCWGLIVAAGSAQRYGQELPKQYQLIGDVPLLQFSLNCFNAVPDIAGMVVGVSMPASHRRVPTTSYYQLGPPTA